MTKWPGAVVAAWGTAYLEGKASLEPVIDAILGDRSSAVRQAVTLTERAPWEDPLPSVELVPQGESIGLGQLLRELRQRGVRRLHVAFPIPGDADGIGPGPAMVPAMAAEHAIIIEPLYLVAVVEKTADELNVALYSQSARVYYLSPSEANLELTQAVQQSAGLLTGLDLVSRNSAVGRISSSAMHKTEHDFLPAVCSSRASHLLARAEQIRTVLALSDLDGDSATISSHEARARSAALQPLRRYVARALGAAYNSVPYTE